MTAMTLKEAAQEVLNASRANSPKEPMQNLQAVRGKQPNAGGGPDNANDLGGATLAEPDGGEVGQRAAALRGTATPPGQQPAAGSKEPMKKLDKPAVATELQKAGEEPEGDPEENDGGHPATGGPWTSTEYMHPTIGEETETEEEEEIELTPEELEEARKEKMEKIKEKMKKHDCKEDIDAIFSGETLSKEFRTKVTTIFEAAVITRALEVIEPMEEEILEAAEETVEEIREELEERIDTYLTYMVEEWKKENEVAIEKGLQIEVVEDFMEGLKNLFNEHYVDVSSEKMDLATELADQLEEANAKLNEIINTNVVLNKKVLETTKKDIISSVCEGLVATQAAKIKTLAESVEFTTEGEYAQKIKIIRESYMNPSATKGKSSNETVALTETLENEPKTLENGEVHVDAEVNAYMKAMERTQRA